MYTIAEIGINQFYGKSKSKFLENTKRLIDIAVSAGCSAVKFQKRNPDICVPELQKVQPRDVPWRDETTTYLQYKKDIEFGLLEYTEIDKYCKEKHIEWSASPWDIDSAIFLADNFDLPWVKLASASIADLELVEFCANNFKKIIISTGMSKLSEIENAINIIKKQTKNIVVMHTNSSYPTKTEDVNLNRILKLQEMYPDYSIGYSNHHFGLTAPMIAPLLGASYIEFHITESHDLYGTDQKSSIEPHGVFKLLKCLKEIDTMMGDDEVGNPTKSEMSIREKLRK